MTIGERRAALIERELPDMPGWCTVEKGKRISELSVGASLCVELGVFGGRSLFAIAVALKVQGFGRVDGIDPYTAAAALEGVNSPENDKWWGSLDYETIARVAQETLYKFDLVQHAHLVRMRSLDVVDFYKRDSIDLLHQDSNHSEEISCEEAARWGPRIRPGGHWVFDDTDWSTTKQAQRVLTAIGFDEVEDHERWKVYRKHV